MNKDEGSIDAAIERMKRKTKALPIHKSNIPSNGHALKNDNSTGINGLALFEEGEKKTAEIVRQRKELEELERKKFLSGLSWDAPYKRYANMYKGVCDGFVEQDAKDFFSLLNKIRIYMDTYGSVRGCINEHISNGDMRDASKKFLNTLMFALVGFYKFKLEKNPDLDNSATKDFVVWETLGEKVRNHAMDTAVESFKVKNKVGNSERALNDLCKEGNYAYTVFENTMGDLSDCFRDRFEKIYKRDPATIRAFHKLVHGDKIGRLLPVLETMANLKGYVTGMLKHTVNAA